MPNLPQPLLISLCVAVNGISSVSIILLNKWIFEKHNFEGSCTLTLIHFVMTFIGLLFSLKFGLFEWKSLSVLEVLPLSISFCGFVVLTNMSLMYNSVGFYQLIKVLTTPLLVLMETFIHKKTFSGKIKLSIALICIGVAMATVSDHEMNLVGTVVALSALLITCQYQIWVGTKQKELECDSFQLLLYQAPLSSVLLLPVAYFTEYSMLRFPSNEALIIIIFSGVVAFFVNISIFLIIGKTSPVTYNVLGHFKLCVVLFLGFLFFDANMNGEKVLGIILTLAGIFWYTQLKTKAHSFSGDVLLNETQKNNNNNLPV